MHTPEEILCGCAAFVFTIGLILSLFGAFYQLHAIFKYKKQKDTTKAIEAVFYVCINLVIAAFCFGFAYLAFDYASNYTCYVQTTNDAECR